MIWRFIDPRCARYFCAIVVATKIKSLLLASDGTSQITDCSNERPIAYRTYQEHDASTRPEVERNVPHLDIMACHAVNHDLLLQNYLSTQNPKDTHAHRE